MKKVLSDCWIIFKKEIDKEIVIELEKVEKVNKVEKIGRVEIKFMGMEPVLAEKNKETEKGILK